MKKEFNETIVEVLEDIDKCWNMLIVNNTKEAMGVLNNIFNKTEVILNQIALVNKDYDVDSIYSIFIKMENCMKIADYILLADFIKYELKGKFVELSL